MSEPVYFTLEGDFRGWTQDAASDGNYTPENVGISATVTITPLLDGVIRATTASPRPIAHLMAPTVAIIDPADGRLKLRTAGESGNPGGFTFTPVRLLANSEYLEIDPTTPLFYRLTFTSVSFGGIRGSIPSWDVEAPSADVTVNIVESAPQSGAIANGVTKIAPGGVRLDGNNLQFTFGGVDIPDPIPASVFQGATGTTGPAATVGVGTTTTGAAGSTAAVANSGTSGAAVLDFTIPRGDTGSTGPTGAAATISVGTVTTGAAGSTAAVINTGTSGAAVFDIAIPRGDTGATGATGATGNAATLTVGSVSTGLPGSDATVSNSGTSGAAILDITIPRGATGAVGATGPVGPTGAAATVAIGTVTTGGAGSAASVTNVGTSTAAVFDITIPKGDTGSADPSTWSTLDGKPAVVAAGATKADARTAIDAEYTGNKGNANGYASLDSAGKVPYSQLPASIMSYQGVWNASTNTPSLADGSGDVGDVYRVSVAGTRNLGSGSISWGVGDYAIYDGSVWQKSDSTDAVASVNGYTGVVSLTKSDVGLSAVDNTADADKPISTATATALAGKEPTITAGSTGQYWTGLKSWATLNAAAVSGAEATANKGAANGYAGLDSTSKVAIANLPTGTSSTTVAIGNDSRITGAEQTSNKGVSGGYAGLDSSAKVAIGNLPTGTTSSTVAIGNDSRITGAEQTANKDANNGYAGLNSSGKLALSKLATTGTADSTTYLRGDGAWSTGFNRSISSITTNTTLGSAAATDYVVFCGDPSFNNVTALLGCDGTNGSTTITDNSSTASSWTVAGNAQLSTSVKKFGTASLAVDGTGDYIYPTTNSSNFAFGTGDFTIEMWIYPSTSQSTIVYDSRPLSTNGAYATIYLNSMALAYIANGSLVISGGTVSSSAWSHIAVSRASGTTKLFLNGTQVGSSYTDSTDYLNPSNRPFIAGHGFRPGDTEFNGYIDDIRVSKVARYTTNFTPPTDSFTTAITATLPTAANNTNQYTVKNIGVAMTVGTTSSQKIDGSSSYSLTTNAAARFISDGSNWRTV